MFVAIVSVLLIVATGQYELAITLPKKEKNVTGLVYLTWSISFITSALVFVLLLIFKDIFLSSFKFINYSLVIYFIPIAILTYSLYQPVYYLGIRNKMFKFLAISSVLNIISTLFFQIAFSFTPLKAYGLMFGYFLSTVLVFIFLLLQLSRKKLINFPGLSFLRDNALRYRNFPLFNLPSLIINVLANQLPNVFLNNFFSAAITGHYSLTNRVLGSPSVLISKSILDVFKERASRDYRKTGSCRDIFMKTLKALFLLAIVPFGLLFLLSPIIIPFIFGSQWVTAGKFAQILTIMFFARFIVSPLSYVFIIAEKQRFNLLLQSFILLSTLISFSFGYYYKNAYLFLIVFTLLYTLMYIIVLVYSYKFAKNEKVS